MFKTTQKEIRSLGNEELFWERLAEYQTKHNTTGICSAYTLGLKRIGYSAGVYGCNGSIFQDIETGLIIGVPGRNVAIYCD